MARPAHTPIRTCVGCRARDVRTRLVRVVAHGEALTVDARGRVPGRGAYLHAQRTCLEAFARKGGFVRSLHCVIPKAERDAFRDRFAEQ